MFHVISSIFKACLMHLLFCNIDTLQEKAANRHRRGGNDKEESENENCPHRLQCLVNEPADG